MSTFNVLKTQQKQQFTLKILYMYLNKKWVTFSTLFILSFFITSLSYGQDPVLTAPTSGSTYSSSNALVFAYNLPSAPYSNTATLTLAPGYSYEMPSAIGSNTYTITSNIPADGTYTCTVSYKIDATTTYTSTAQVTLTIDRTTQNPSILAPITNNTYRGALTFTFITPDQALSNSKKLTFSQNGTSVSQLTINTSNTGTLNLNLKALSLTNPEITAISGTYTTSIPDGTYSVTYSYRDDLSNPAASSTVNITIDSQTLPATLTQPLAGTTYTNPIPVSLNLGEMNAPGTLNLTFEYTDGTYSNTLTLVDNTPSQTFTFTNNNIWPTSNVTTATHTTLMDGLYNVKLTYQDVYYNPLYSTTNSNVRIQTNTPLPTLSDPITGSVFNGTSTPTFSYALPSAPFSGTAQLTLTSAGSAYVYSLPNQVGSNTFTITTNAPQDGTYSWTVRYQDFLGNPAATSATSLVIFDRATLSPTITSPLTNAINTGTATITYSTPENAYSGSKKIFISQNGTAITTINVIDNNTGTLNLNFKDLTVSNSQITSVSGTTNIPDGTYSLTYSYKDAANNTAASNSINFSIDESTIRIPINAPLPNSIVTNNLNLKFTLPEAMLSGSLKLHLKSTTQNIFFTLADIAPNTYDWNINPSANILTTYPSKFTSVSPSTITNIPAGTYTLTMIYQDAVGNRTDSGMYMSNIKIKPSTLTPILRSPQANAYISRTLILMDTVLESNLVGSKKITILKNNNAVTTIILKDLPSDTLYFDTHHLSEIGTKITSITGIDSLVDGEYVIQLSYQDVYGNPAATASSAITIDNSPLIGVLSHTGNIVYGTFTETLTFNKPVNSFYSNSIIPNIINNTPSATFGSFIPNSNNKVYTFSVTPLQQGFIKIQGPVEGIARDMAGNPSQVIAIDSVKYIDTLIPTKPIVISPTNNKVISNTLIYQDSIPGMNIAGTKVLKIFKNNSIVTTITLKDKLKDTLYFDTHRLSSSLLNVASISGIDSLSDGNYYLQLSYQNLIGDTYTSLNDSITIDTSPFIGVLSHTDNTVFGSYTQTLTFNKPVDEIGTSGIISNIINNSPAANIGALRANTNKTIYTFTVTPLQQGIIKIQCPVEGIARDIAGNPSRVIAIDSVKYIDTLQLLTPIISGNVSFCQGDSVTLTSSLANSYLWSTGDTTRSIVVKKGGNYNVKTRYDDYVKGISSTVTITSNPIPSAPSLSRDVNNNLVSSSKIGNIWYLNGNKLNDTSNTIKPNTAGNYNARTIQLGCASAIGPNYYFVITNLQNISVNEFIKLTPNPFVNNVNADFRINGYQSLKLEVFDMNTGNLVMRKDRVDAGLNIQIPDISSGVYLFKLSTNDGKISRQFKMVKL